MYETVFPAHLFLLARISRKMTLNVHNYDHKRDVSLDYFAGKRSIEENPRVVVRKREIAHLRFGVAFLTIHGH